MQVEHKYFLNSQYTSANEAQSVKVDIISDNSWHIATFDMSSNQYWTHSTVTGFRYDWCENTNITMQISFFVLLKDVWD